MSATAFQRMRREAAAREAEAARLAEEAEGVEDGTTDGEGEQDGGDGQPGGGDVAGEGAADDTDAVQGGTGENGDQQAVDIGKLNKREVMAELKQMGIEFDSAASVGELRQQLIDSV